MRSRRGARNPICGKNVMLHRVCSVLTFAPVEPRHRYIVVEGPIGFGKSPDADALKRLNARSVFELVEKPFLASFYQDRKQAAFQTPALLPPQPLQAAAGALPAGALLPGHGQRLPVREDRIFASITLDTE